MATFVEELWNSIFTPGTTPTLLVATNASFAALQFLLLILFLSTYSIHFFILSVISAGLWYAINWFARELQLENAKNAHRQSDAPRGRSPETGSDTETEVIAEQRPASPPPLRPKPAHSPVPVPISVATHSQSDLLKSGDNLRRRRSLGDSSGYVSTDSEWEKVSEGGTNK